MTKETYNPQITLDYALAYLRRDMAVIPIYAPKEGSAGLVCGCGKSDCRTPAKHPVSRLVPNGVENATKDADTVRRWFSGDQYNVAVVGGLLSKTSIVDIDVKNNGHETLRSLEAKHGPLPKTLWWHTGGGGEHRIFKCPPEGFENSVQRLGPGLDIRGDKGYVVAPPSQHISGNYYRIPGGCSIDDPIADLPEWVKAANSRKKEKTEQPRTGHQDKIFEGGRNNAVTKMAGVLIGKGLSFQLSLEFMLAWNKAHCEPPLSDQEVNSVVENIFRAESSKPAPPIISAAELPTEVAPREWLVPQWLPKGRVAALIGPGAIGKTLLAQQLATALSANYFHTKKRE